MGSPGLSSMLRSEWLYREVVGSVSASLLVGLWGSWVPWVPGLAVAS